MEFKIYNSKTRKREIFKPFKEGEVKMYCCGPTVYDFLHVGNFRGAVFYNFVFNWLKRLGYKVSYAYNFTDVDDKILNRAKAEGVSSKEIADRFIGEFWKDFKALKLSSHTHNPRVTEHIDSIIDLIGELIEKGRAYVVEGEVFYSIDSFSDYGKLSHRSPSDMRSGSRIEVDSKKRNPLDFSLWKPVLEGQTGWPSPWGRGRPGWHIECSAMTRSLFGEQIDIHGGGMDLIFPHHENEIAQSEGATGKEYAGYWVHNNMFTFGGAKMSKSLGNIRRMRDFLEKFNGETFKYMVLSVHYRSEADFTEATIQNATLALGRIYSSLGKAFGFVGEGADSLKGSGEGGMAENQSGLNRRGLSKDSYPGNQKNLKTERQKKMAEQIVKTKKNCESFFNDDFSTPQAMAELFEVIRLYNHLIPSSTQNTEDSRAVSRLFIDFVMDFGKPMALFQENPLVFLKNLDDKLLEQKKLHRSEVESLVQARRKARKQKNYEESDRLRDQLTKLGIELKDTGEETLWEVKK